MSRGDVAIVGMACVFPGAADMGAYWRNIVNGVDAITELPPERWPGSRATQLPADHEGHVPCSRGGFVPTPYLFDAARFRVMPNVARYGDPDQFLLMDVLLDALEDAGIGREHAVRTETDLIVGRGGYTSNKMLEVFLRGDGIDRTIDFLARRAPQLGAAELERLEREMRDSLPPYDVDGLASAVPNLVASRAANRLDLGGAAYTVDAACASALVAVEHAVTRLRAGSCNVALAAGVNFTHIPAFWYLFTRILAMSPTGRIRPFDKRADGLLVGEGAGVVVLKRVEDAARDGDRVYALLRGVGTSSDGRAAGVLAPSSAGQVRAVRKAYEDAGVDPATVGFLEAHGTGTRLGDAAELETVARVFGPPTAGHGTRVIGSVKSMIGHTMPAAGVASLVKAALAISNRVLPPTLHCEQPHPALAETAFFVTGEARPWIQDPGRPRRAAVNAFGFGGVNAHIVLEEVPAASPSRTVGPRPRPVRSVLDRPSELLAFAAPDRSGLAARLRAVGAFLREDRAPWTLEDVAYTLAREATAGSCRLALVRENAAGLAEEFDDVADRLDRGASVGETRAGVFFEERGDEPVGKVAAIFPGIAFPGLVGEFPWHLLRNCLYFPAVREVFDRVEDRDRHLEDPLPTSFLLVPPAHLPQVERAALQARFGPPPAMRAGGVYAPDPDERNLAHMAMLANNWASWRLLQELGIRVDMLCGQSLGDVSAVLAAGMLDFDESVDRFWELFDLELPYESTGCIAVVGTSEERLRPYLADLPEVTIGLHLSPETQVVGGTEEQVKALCTRLREANVLAQKLPFPPIHTPHLRRIEEQFVSAAERVSGDAPLRPASATIYSGVLAGPMPDDPAAVRELLRSNVSSPIRFWQTIRRMYDDGARFVVQIGSGTMAANTRTLLEAEDAVAVAMDVAHRDPLTQLQRMCGQLFVHGFDFDLPALHAARRPRLLPLDAPRPAPVPPPTAVPLTFYWPPLHTAADAPPPSPPEPALGRAPEAPAASEASTGAPLSALPFLGNVTTFVPDERVVLDLRLALDEQIYLEDHVFIHARPFKPLSECFPVVPLAMTLEILAQAAACVAPGLGLIGFDRVRATRWIAFEEVDVVELRVEAARESVGAGVIVVRTEVFLGEDRVASALVRFAERYRETLSLTFSELAEPAPFPATARDLYADRVLFHGPRLRTVHSLDVRGERGITGALEVLPRNDLFASLPAPCLLTDPAVIDGAGQVVGAFFLGAEGYLLPVAVDRIEFYRPAPEPGTRAPIRVEFVEIDLPGRRTSANIEVQDGSGQVWFRIAGWQDVIFHWKERVLRNLREPLRYALADETDLAGLPAGAVAALLPRDEVRELQEEWLARAYLNATEWTVYRGAGFATPRRRAWLLGRVAAKDAVRLWRRKRTGGEMLLHPAQITLANDASGRPIVAEIAGIDGVDAPPSISIAHGEWGAAAVAADMPVGIDVEPVGAADRFESDDWATDAEIARLGDLEHGLTRLWCAKESAAKALGRGLEGRPKSWEAVAVDEGGLVSIHRRGSGDRVDVWTARHGDSGADLVVAVGRAPAASRLTGGAR